MKQKILAPAYIRSLLNGYKRESDHRNWRVHKRSCLNKGSFADKGPDEEKFPGQMCVILHPFYYL